MTALGAFPPRLMRGATAAGATFAIAASSTVYHHHTTLRCGQSRLCDRGRQRPASMTSSR